MDLIILSFFAIVPLLIGVLIINIIKETKLTVPLLLFLFFGSVWQFDVATLYSHIYLSAETVDFLFRFLRFGPIMLTPTLFYLAYSIAINNFSFGLETKWRFVVNKYVLVSLYIWGLFVYLIGWTSSGVKELVFIETIGGSGFLFPIYGSLSWIFTLNVGLLIVGFTACLFLLTQLENSDFKSFLRSFTIVGTISYGIAAFNMLPEAKLYPSGIAVIFFAVSIFKLAMKLQIATVTRMNVTLTEQKKKIRYLAYHDELTELPNRRLFNEDLELKIEEAKHNDEILAIIFMDLDRFKNINDTLGHNIGDLLLFEISKKLKKLTTLTNNQVSIYRLAGDEFTVIIEKENELGIDNIAKSILAIFNEPIQVEQYNVSILPSMGISIYPKDGIDANTLMINADFAMYFVKESIQNRIQYYTPEISRNFHRSILIEKQLQTALEKNEFELFFQPKLNLKTQMISGMETLLRWDNKEFGKVAPGEFIPIAEESNLILSISEWVLKEACLQNKKWQNEGYPPLTIAVNISIKQFSLNTFVETVSNTLTETQLDPKYLELEITESIAIKDINSTIEKLQLLKNLGVSIAIDDFGTGYSSLSYLKRYPVDVLKIDRSFITNMAANEENKVIVESILSIATHFNLDVVAEGVETDSDLRLLNNRNVQYVQGYYIGRPVPALEFEKNYLKEGNFSAIKAAKSILPNSTDA
ncbi:putative bifunctional diguanylate cyclase/phosphodiesterase [Sporosarcina sp. CAU 1771]